MNFSGSKGTISLLLERKKLLKQMVQMIMRTPPTVILVQNAEAKWNAHAYAHAVAH